MSIFLLLLFSIALAGCSGAPPVIEQTTSGKTAVPAVDPFEEALKKALEAGRAMAPPRPSTSSSAVEDLRGAMSDEREIVRAMRQKYDEDGQLPPLMVDDLITARDRRFDATFRLLVDEPHAPLPPELTSGGVR